MAMPTRGAFPVARRELWARTALVLEVIALRHQIVVLELSRTRRPCFGPSDRLLWILLSQWWRGWNESLMIVQPQTVLHSRLNGWSAMWVYRSCGCNLQAVKGTLAQRLELVLARRDELPACRRKRNAHRL